MPTVPAQISEAGLLRAPPLFPLSVEPPSLFWLAFAAVAARTTCGTIPFLSAFVAACRRGLEDFGVASSVP